MRRDGGREIGKTVEKQKGEIKGGRERDSGENTMCVREGEIEGGRDRGRER